jgi:hypothetical protein
MLLDPPVFGARSLWLSWFGVDGRMLPVVIPINDLPLIPEPALVMNLREVHDSIVEQHLAGQGHLAMALCRPGGSEVRGDDDAWVDALSSALDEGQIDGSWSLHLAAGGRVVPVVEPTTWRPPTG